MGHKRTSGMTSAPPAMKELSRWIRSRSVRVKLAMTVLMAIISLFLLKFFVKRHNQFFIASHVAHALGLFVLLYKLSFSETCSGLSLKMQELMAIFLVARLLSVFSFGLDIHVVINSINLVATLWVIYMMQFKLKSTYMEKLDNMPLYYVLVPCAIIAVLAHPEGDANIVVKLLWSFNVTIEAFSVLPQLRLIKNAKMVERFTAHYVFALGVARFLACANWIIEIIESRGAYFMLVRQGHLWILVALISEGVNTFILSDFCYCYVKSIMEGQVIMRLPSNV